MGCAYYVISPRSGSSSAAENGVAVNVMAVFLLVIGDLGVDLSRVLFWFFVRVVEFVVGVVVNTLAACASAVPFVTSLFVFTVILNILLCVV